MHEQQPHEPEQAAAPPSEARRESAELQPRIYVASLADYNAGRLHGRWIDADQDQEALAEQIQAMLAASPEPGGEEWAIHDYEGFAGLRLGEYEDMATLARLARGLVEHGPAFGALADWLGHQEATTDSFEEHYRGHWDSLTDYADDLLRDLGAEEYLQNVPDWLQPYVRLEVEAFGRDLQLGGDIYVDEAAEGGVYVFDVNV